MSIIDYGAMRLPDGHPLKGTQNNFGAKQSESSSNAVPQEPTPPLGAQTERVAVSDASRTTLDTPASPKRATLGLPRRLPSKGPHALGQQGRKD
jgi:hypothetical protein